MLFLAVEVKEGAVATGMLSVICRVGSHKGCPDVEMKCKTSGPMSKLTEAYCSAQHLKPETVIFTIKDGTTFDEHKTPSDLGLQENDVVTVTVKDVDADAVLKKAGCTLFDACEALEKTGYQPRQALKMISSIQQAKAAAAKKALEDEEKAAAQRLIDLELGKCQDATSSSQDQEEGAGGVRKKKKKGRALGDADFGFGTLEITHARAEGWGNAGAVDVTGGRKVFVGGTDWREADELKDHFSMFGEVQHVDVLRERDGSFRGFAFITFFEAGAAARLLAQHHTMLDGTRMEAKPCVQSRDGAAEGDFSRYGIASSTTSAGSAELPPPSLSSAAWGPPPGGETFTGISDTSGSCMDTAAPVDDARKPDVSDDDVCSICWDDLANASLRPCGHKFCSACISQLKKQAVYQAKEGVHCPNCRAAVREFVIPEEEKKIVHNKPAWGGGAAASSAPTSALQTVPKAEEASGAVMSVKVRFLGDEEIEFEVWPLDSADSLKDKIAEATGHPGAAQRLIYAGKILEGAVTMEQCKIINGVTIHCTVNREISRIQVCTLVHSGMSMYPLFPLLSPPSVPLSLPPIFFLAPLSPPSAPRT